ncbi:hypothetical protein ACQYZY_27140 [Pseudomonas aeruginosa]|jgi:hypothetical protein|nr:hypothetical protein [Pseudomonas aeruginosa]EKV0397527.1 hypothetical protein [Pseudomonas aeruginosa]EKV3012621.1 hypothetical protein [Pseudomonas aeruginosa]MBH4318196.1 hypothetical protein [Pseudomonas aeruginosa]MBH8699583.1 hypothetical protein [Pseudomonas aeruginosa]WBM10752.1 hypothetical protein M1V28_32540 [Pseudomonas aeruginosa]
MMLKAIATLTLVAAALAYFPGHDAQSAVQKASDTRCAAFKANGLEC